MANTTVVAAAPPALPLPDAEETAALDTLRPPEPRPLRTAVVRLADGLWTPASPPERRASSSRTSAMRA
jgi:hypothetical protein